MHPAPAFPVSAAIGNIPPAPQLSTDKCQPSESTFVANRPVPVLQPYQQPPTATTLNSTPQQPHAPKYFLSTYKGNSYVASLDFVYYFHYLSMTQCQMPLLSLLILRLILSGFAFNSNRNPASFSQKEKFADSPYDRGKTFVNLLKTGIIVPLQDTDRFTTFYYPRTNLSHRLMLDDNDDIISCNGKITATIDSDNLCSLCAKDISDTLSDGGRVQIMTQTIYIDISYY